MDEFDVVSEVGTGTTVTMVKWRPGGSPTTRKGRT
jgi:anti-sigma regulatory factor (Ser/Thr protein kinase)